MVDDAVKAGDRKPGVAARQRARGAGKPAVPPVLPPIPAAPEVPAALANPAVVPAPAAEPQAARTMDPEPAASAAPLEVKEVKMNETVTTFADKAQDQAKAFADKAQEQARTAFTTAGEQGKVAMEKGRKVAEDMAEFGKGNVEALVESARIAAEAIEAMGQEAATFARTRYESTAQMIQTLASVKSPTEAMQIQADYFRSAFDALVKEASRSTEATLKLAGDVAKPLQNRMAVAADKFRTAA